MRGDGDETVAIVAIDGWCGIGEDECGVFHVPVHDVSREVSIFADVGFDGSVDGGGFDFDGVILGEVIVAVRAVGVVDGEGIVVHLCPGVWGYGYVCGVIGGL